MSPSQDKKFSYPFPLLLLHHIMATDMFNRWDVSIARLAAVMHDCIITRIPGIEAVLPQTTVQSGSSGTKDSVHLSRLAEHFHHARQAEGGEDHWGKATSLLYLRHPARLSLRRTEIRYLSHFKRRAEALFTRGYKSAQICPLSVPHITMNEHKDNYMCVCAIKPSQGRGSRPELARPE